MSNVNEKQVGGTHYNQVQTQHWDLMLLNRVPYLEAQITKYVTRWKKKHGVQDVEKSTHYLEKLQDALSKGELPYPTPELTSALAPRVVPAAKFDEFVAENGIGDIEKTIFYLLLTYTSKDELYRVGVLLQHLLGMAKKMERERNEAAMSNAGQRREESPAEIRQRQEFPGREIGREIGDMVR